MDITHPNKIEEISADWMNWVLHSAEVCRKSSVTHIEFRDLPAGHLGNLSGLARVNLTYDQMEEGLPHSVVVKMPSSSRGGREWGNSYNAYEREARFYQDIAPTSPIRIPRCYLSLMDIHNDNFILVLEDVSQHNFGDQVKGLTAKQVLDAIHTIAPFHAYWWDHKKLSQLTWMPKENLDILHLFAQNWPDYRHRFFDQMNEEERAIGDRLNWQGDRLAELHVQSPRTIVHSDFRADNLIFDETSQEHPVIVLDWQLAQRNLGAYDVARVVCGSVPFEDQQGRHREFVNAWHEGLMINGVREYSQHEAWRDFQTALLMSLYTPVAFHHLNSHEGGRGLQLARAYMHRIFRAAVECDAASVLQ